MHTHQEVHRVTRLTSERLRRDILPNQNWFIDIMNSTGGSIQRDIV